jgi:uncharacterized membrane protein YfcA
MDELIISPYFLAGIFFVVAFAYASVGLGGGSSYAALMAIFGVSHLAIPTIALTLNLVVTSAASINYIRHRHLRLGLILPFMVTSIPFSYLGGSLVLPEEIFYWLLLITLCVVLVRIYAFDTVALRVTPGRSGQIAIALFTGSLLGFIAGSVGIGGGVYLVPLIIILGLGTEKEAAACGAAFVLLNSVSGLIARLPRHGIDILEIMPLLVAVLVGGLAGSQAGSARFSSRMMDKILGVIILVAILFLVRRLWH